MDQIPSTDTDEVTDKCGLQYDSLVNLSKGNINFPNLVGDKLACGSSNEEKSLWKPSDSLLDTESPTSENDVPSTYCAENEVIPNEDGLVVEKNLTCYAVQDFEKVDNSSSKEMDAECSSERTTVDDISVHSNVNNPVEELPSASDFIKLSSAPNHVELLSASDHVELPSVSHHIELPSPCDHVELPFACDQIKLPSPCDQTELLSASDHIDLPCTSDHTEQPSASDHIEPPSVSNQIELPLVSDLNKLSSSFDHTPVSSFSYTVANTNAESSPNTEPVSNAANSSPIAEVVTSTEVNPTTEVVTNAEFSPNAKASLNTEDVTIAEANPNSDVVPNGEASFETEVITNAKGWPNTEAISNAADNPIAEVVANAEANSATDVVFNVEASPNIEDVTNAEASPNTDAVTNSEASLNTEVVSNAEGSPNFEVINAEASPNTDAVTNSEASLNTEVVSNAEDSPNFEVINAEVSTNTEVVTHAGASPNIEVNVQPDTNTKVVTHAESSLNTEDVINAEASPITDAVTNGETNLNTEVVSNAEGSLNFEAINAEASAKTEVVTHTGASLDTEVNAQPDTNTEVVTHAESSLNIEDVINAEASPNTDAVINAEASPNTDAVTNGEASPNTDAVTNGEASLNTEVVSNTEGSPNFEVTNAEASCNTEVVTHAGTSSNTEVIAQPDVDTEVVTHAEFSLNTEVITNAEASSNANLVTNTEASLNTEVVSNVEASLNTDVLTNDEASSTTDVVTNAKVSHYTEAVTNPDSSHQPNEDTDDVTKIQNVCDSPSKETNPVNVENLNYRNNFLPTIIAIRGGCTNVLEKTNSLPEDISSSTLPEISSLNIVSVLGGCKDIDPDSEISKTSVGSSSPKTSDQIVHTISDSKETAALYECPDNPTDSDITIKQEHHDSFPDNDYVHTGTEHATTPITSEFPIKEDKTANTKVEDPEVICIETTSEIPLPIPIKMESNIGGLNVVAESRSSNKTGKFTAKKRLTRSNLSQSDDCIILSSGSDVDSVSDSKKRNHSSTNAYSTAGYTCHLCNTVFQEHELLNEHMILHRNNSLIEAKVQNRSKTTRVKVYSCNICQKQLSTSQSLQQHVLIHKNEKPFVCSICQKDFRHLQNYRMHLQKHKAEQRRRGKPQEQGVKEQLDKSVVRGVDFGRLVGPLFMKESLWHQEKDTSLSKNLPSDAASSSATNKKTAFRYTSKESVSHQPRLSFDQPPFKTNVNPSSSSPVIIRRREPSPDSRSEEECIAVKSFSNIESVVMNAAKIIVKLDNLDTSVLKRKLQTPDISIDLPPKKCRVMLSPIAEKCNVKLDEIENIPMDIDAGEIDSPATEQIDSNQDNYLDEGNKDTADSSACPPQGTLTDNELFDLLNDDTISADSGYHVSNGKSQIYKPDHCAVDNSTSDSIRTVASPLHKRSNVIFMEASPNYEMCAYEDEETVDNRLDDAFDTAFQKVAARRLALLRKRATKNGGKVESRFLLGPLFWRKALRRAQKGVGDTTAVANVDITFSSSKNGSRGAALRTRPSPFGGRSRFDNRRTNDPTKLQLRAERKFKYMLELAKMLSNLNSLNLAGPLFWRRTLQLAGVHRGEDLRMHVNVTSPTLDGIEFVDDGGQPCDFDDVLVNVEKISPSQPSDPVQPSPSHQIQRSLTDPVQSTPSNPLQSSPSHCVQPSSSSEVPASCTVSDNQKSSDQLAAGGLPFASNVVAGELSKLAGEMQTSIAHPEPPSHNATTKNTSNEVASLTTDSILYESLTKPKEIQLQSTKPEGISPSYVDSTSLFGAAQGTAVESSLASHLKAEVVENCSKNQSNRQCPELTGDMAVDEGIAKLEAIESGSIVLDVDSGGGLQLIPAADQIPITGAGQNFVLVSDGSGTMQYMVNVPGDNFGNFELIGNGAGGDQVAYAIQFDGENYAAVQFVQDGGIQLQSDAGMKEAQMLVDPKAATYLVADTGATAAAVADPSHIGKELSDFLNLDYNLLKNGAADQPIS